MDSQIVHAKIGREKYKTEIVVGDHQLVADESLEVGGQNSGPSPGDFLRMSLATCTAITLRMYADRKQWDVEDIEVAVTSSTENRVTKFACTIKVKGNIDDTQRERLKQIADACPLHKTLLNPMEIETTIAR